MPPRFKSQPRLTRLSSSHHVLLALVFCPLLAVSVFSLHSATDHTASSPLPIWICPCSSPAEETLSERGSCHIDIARLSNDQWHRSMSTTRKKLSTQPVATRRAASVPDWLNRGGAFCHLRSRSGGMILMLAFADHRNARALQHGEGKKD